MSLYLVHSIASPSRQRAADNRSRRPASKIERWCPTAREQAACDQCALTATLQVGRAAQQRCRINKKGSRESPRLRRGRLPLDDSFHTSVVTRDAATSSPAHGPHRATPVSRRCVLATSKTTAHRRGMEPECSKSLGVLLQAALAFSGGASIVACGHSTNSDFADLSDYEAP